MMFRVSNSGSPGRADSTSSSIPVGVNRSIYTSDPEHSVSSLYVFPQWAVPKRVSLIFQSILFQVIVQIGHGNNLRVSKNIMRFTKGRICQSCKNRLEFCPLNGMTVAIFRSELLALRLNGWSCPVDTLRFQLSQTIGEASPSTVGRRWEPRASLRQWFCFRWWSGPTAICSCGAKMPRRPGRLRSRMYHFHYWILLTLLVIEVESVHPKIEMSGYSHSSFRGQALSFNKSPFSN